MWQRIGHETDATFGPLLHPTGRPIFLPGRAIAVCINLNKPLARFRNPAKPLYLPKMLVLCPGFFSLFSVFLFHLFFNICLEKKGGGERSGGYEERPSKIETDVEKKEPVCKKKKGEQEGRKRLGIVNGRKIQ